MSFFKESKSLEMRLKEAEHMMQKYPDRIPIIVERSKKCNNIPDIEKKKYLVPKDLTVGQFMYIIRKKINLEPTKTMFLFCNNILPPTSMMIQLLYDQKKEVDNFLYLTYASENTFG